MANEDFSLLGGPLHRLGRRLGLVRGTNTVRLGLALGFVPWAVLMLLVVLEGAGREAFSLARVAAHVRFLVVIPLFFICETWLDPQLGRFVRYLVDSAVVPEGTVPALQSAVARTARLRDSWLAEAAFVVLAVFSPWIAQHLPFLGVTGTHETGDIETASALAGRLYWTVCLPLFRFLMFRWIRRLALWWRFLWKVSRLDLHLVPTHPDGAAGLGYLEIVHAHFIPLVLAVSAVMSASFAEDISTGRMTFTSLYTGRNPPRRGRITLPRAALHIRARALALPGQRHERLHDPRGALRGWFRREMGGRI